MKMASSEPNIVSWPQMNETASRDREQNHAMIVAITKIRR